MSDAPNRDINNISMTLDPYWCSIPTVPTGSSNNRGVLWDSYWSGVNLGQGFTFVVLFSDSTLTGIDEEQNPQYAEDLVLGRVEPFTTWTSEGGDTFSLNFSFAAQNFTDTVLVPTGNPELNIMLVGRYLQALSRPLYDAPNDQTIEPPVVIVSIGMLKVARAVVRSCRLKWSGDFAPATMVPNAVTATMVFQTQRIPTGVYSGGYSSYYGTSQGTVPTWNRFIEF